MYQSYPTINLNETNLNKKVKFNVLEDGQHIMVRSSDSDILFIV